MKKIKYLAIAILVLVLISIGVRLSSPPTERAERADVFNVVMDAAIATNGAVPTMKAVALKAALDSSDPSDDPLVVDLRTSDEYMIGHISGAINIYYRNLGKSDALDYLNSKLDEHVAAGKKNEIVVYTNTHHTCQMVAVYLKETQNLPAKALNNGLAEWTQNETVAPGRFKECTTFDPVTGKGISPPGCTSDNFPTTLADAINADDLSGEGYLNLDNIPEPVTAENLPEIARLAYDARFGDPSKPDYRMTSRELYDLLDDNQDGVIQGPDDDLSNDPFILSNRGTDWGTCLKGAYHNRGHIPSAIAVNWCRLPLKQRQELRALDRTDFMPTDKLVVHHCWVGKSQQYGGPWYNLLGYDVVSLDWGMNGWSDSDDVRQAVIDPAKWYPNDYPIETTPTPP